MNKIEYVVLDYYNRHVIELIIEKYGMTEMDAVRAFITSKTHRMLEDRDYGMTTFGEIGIFEIWEAERVTGDPRNSRLIREEF